MGVDCCQLGSVIVQSNLRDLASVFPQSLIVAGQMLEPVEIVNKRALAE